MRGTVRLDGAFGATGLVGLIRLHFFAGSATVRFEVTVRNPHRARHAGGRSEYRRSWVGPLRRLVNRLRTASRTRTLAGPLLGGFVRACGRVGTPPFEIYQDSSGGGTGGVADITSTANGACRTRSADIGAVSRRRTHRPPGDPDRRSGAGLNRASRVQHFWQNFPKAVEARRERLVLRLFPRQYADSTSSRAASRRRTCSRVAFGPDRSPTCRSTGAAAAPPWARRPNGTAASRRDPLPRAGGRRSARRRTSVLVQAAIEGADTFVRKRERSTSTAGGISATSTATTRRFATRARRRSSRTTTTSTTRSPASRMQFLRTGDVRWWRRWTSSPRTSSTSTSITPTATSRPTTTGCSGTRATTCDAGTATHRTYPQAARQVTAADPSAGHNYTTGLMLHYFLTGDALSREAAVGWRSSWSTWTTARRRSSAGWTAATPGWRATSATGLPRPGPRRPATRSTRSSTGTA